MTSSKTQVVQEILDALDRPDKKIGVRYGEFIIFAGIYADPCPPDPCKDQDGLGLIHSFSSRHVNFTDPRLLPEDFWKANPFFVPLSYFEHGLCKWGVAGTMGNTPDFRWDGVALAGYWEPDSCCLEHIESSALAHALPEGTKVEYKSKTNPDGSCITRPCQPGEKSYFINPDGSPAGMVSDERFNNVITLILPDGREFGGYKNFVTAYRAAARKLGIKLNWTTLRAAKIEVAEECAAQACETYTMWCNGEVYGYGFSIYKAKQAPSGEVFDQHSDYRFDTAEADESCSGYYGWDEVIGTFKTALLDGLQGVGDACAGSVAEHLDS